MNGDYSEHVGAEHPEVSTYPQRFIRKRFDYCPYCGEEL